MENSIKNSLFSSTKIWLASAILGFVLVPSAALANTSQINLSYTSLDHYLALYYKQNKVKELKNSQKGSEFQNLAKVSEKTKKEVNKTTKIKVIDNLENQTIAKKSQKMVFRAVVVGKKTSADARPDRVVQVVMTAYTSTPDQTDSTPNIAASGKHVYDGMIAANWLPFGTKIKIPALYGDKIFTVDDRMNKRYGYGRMDIWLDASKAEARKFGVKRVEIEVYEKASTKRLVLAK